MLADVKYPFIKTHLLASVLNTLLSKFLGRELAWAVEIEDGWVPSVFLICGCLWFFTSGPNVYWYTAI
jgi:hypothetical protein